jgi:hypothetical protein
MMNLRLPIILSLTAVNLIAFQNCNKVSFSSATPNTAANVNGGGTGSTDPNGGGSGGPGSTGPTPPPGVNVTINTLQPALASRATGCIMCHAQIASNVITDFGFGGNGKGLNYFFGGDAATLPSGLSNNQGGAVYGDYDYQSSGGNVNWGSANLTGSQVIVPRAPTTGINVSESTLALYMKNILQNSPNASTAAVSVKEVKSVYIGAPTAARIIAVSGVSAGALKFKPASASAPAFSGLALESGGKYYTNNPNVPIVCEGDLTVDGVVWLNNAQITTEGGCRMYVTKSVFVTGPISYTSGNDNRNLQISSARAIALGLGGQCNGNDTLNGRLGFSTDDRFRDFFTRGQSNPATMLAEVRADADAIGVLVDAACGPNGARAVSFNRLLLNAPLVESRYQGQYDGAIIAELTLTSLNSLKFSFDPVFTKASVLPLLSPADYLDIVE